MIKISICFSLCFAFCVLCLCLAFVFCLRAWHLHKVEKIDPVFVAKTPKVINAKKRMETEQYIDSILERG